MNNNWRDQIPPIPTEEEEEETLTNQRPGFFEGGSTVARNFADMYQNVTNRLNPIFGSLTGGENDGGNITLSTGETFQNVPRTGGIVIPTPSTIAGFGNLFRGIGRNNNISQFTGAPASNIGGAASSNVPALSGTNTPALSGPSNLPVLSGNNLPSVATPSVGNARNIVFQNPNYYQGRNLPEGWNDYYSVTSEGSAFDPAGFANRPAQGGQSTYRPPYSERVPQGTPQDFTGMENFNLPPVTTSPNVPAVNFRPTQNTFNPQAPPQVGPNIPPVNVPPAAAGGTPPGSLPNIPPVSVPGGSSTVTPATTAANLNKWGQFWSGVKKWGTIGGIGTGLGAGAYTLYNANERQDAKNDLENTTLPANAPSGLFLNQTPEQVYEQTYSDILENLANQQVGAQESYSNLYARSLQNAYRRRASTTSPFTGVSGGQQAQETQALSAAEIAQMGQLGQGFNQTMRDIESMKLAAPGEARSAAFDQFSMAQAVQNAKTQSVQNALSIITRTDIEDTVIDYLLGLEGWSPEQIKELRGLIIEGDENAFDNIIKWTRENFSKIPDYYQREYGTPRPVLN